MPKPLPSTPRSTVQRYLVCGAMPLLLLAGCKQEPAGRWETGRCGESYWVAEDTGLPVFRTCPGAVVSQFPQADATDVYIRTSVEGKLSTEDLYARLSLESPECVPLAGTSSVEGKRVIFIPEGPLTPNTTYTAVLDYYCRNVHWSFTTGDVGPPTNASELPGKTYSLDLASGRFVHPEGVGPLLQEYLTSAILLSVQHVDAGAGTLDVLVATAKEDSSPLAQAACAATVGFPTMDFSQNPYFSLEPTTTVLPFSGVSVTVTDLSLAGSFSADAARIVGGVVTGTFDTRPLVPLLNPEGDEDEICKLAGTIGVSCEPCETDGEPLCLRLHVEAIEASLEPSSSVGPQHLPTQTDPAEGSVDVCSKQVCANEDACLTR